MQQHRWRSVLLLPFFAGALSCATIEPVAVPAGHPASEEAPVAPFEPPPPIGALPDASRARSGSAPAATPAAGEVMKMPADGDADAPTPTDTP